ncbi:MAG: alpha/beta hydrolase [Gammaproteobacteria bacterium]|nr:alpha/beta hydrolase [Gammaproteobacteria bacterium]
MDKYLDNSGCRLWTTACGEGTPFIFCNGGPGCDDYLGPVAEMLEDLCHVVRFEPRGCGRSDYDGNYDLSTTVADIEFIRAAYGFDKIIIGGHSAGTDVALAYTIQYPERVLGLIGLAGGRIVNDCDWSADYHEKLEKFGEDYGGKEFVADPGVNEQGNKSWQQYIKNPDLLANIRALMVPAIFINAADDIRPNWPTRQLAGLIPRGEYHEIEQARHFIWLTHANELKRLLRNAVENILLHPTTNNKETLC